MKNRLIVVLGLAAFVLTGIAAIKPGVKKNERNLKVLPKDISNADLDSVMETYSKHLNVACDFCHAKSKINPNDVDYASDEKPEKEITRQMMKMTAAINKDFFDYTIIYKAGETMAVSCFTCHDGFPRPEMKHEKKQ
ncbi:MAG TPA: c-type cytochrome [Chitinophagaceae bacterium]|nr:c-type cytochrome [Chitinophagaceae bacterium]